MITADTDRSAAVVLGHDTTLDAAASEVTSAVLRATAHGVYEARVNGRPADDSVLNPGWTAYEWRLQVQTYDVTDHVRSGGESVQVEFTLGNGWYRGDLGFEGANANYGDEIGVIAELELTYGDGHTQLVVTDDNWSGHQSRITANSLYNGETIDARITDPGELDVRTVDFDRSTLVRQVGPRIVRDDVLTPQSVWTSPSGKTLVDFGQNLVGWLRIKVHGNAGDEVVVRHAEVIEKDELGVRPLRTAKATDTFVLSGGDDEFEPTFTFHGFRYAEVTGWPGDDDSLRAGIEAVVVHSDIKRTGWFECSHQGVNQLISNSVWGEKGNFLDVPTDCPQRDERLGWTGDIAAYSPTAAYQFDVSNFLHKWLLDLFEETLRGGQGYVPFVVPNVLKFAHFDQSFAEAAEAWGGATAIWGDAAVWVPQALWNAYGDEDRLAQHYPGMVLHLNSVEKVLSPTGLWDAGFQFGDWLDPDASPDEPANAKADKGVVATACLYRSASFAAETAERIGKPQDADHWRQLAGRLRSAFNEHYVGDDGRVKSDCATVYALAICFGLLDDDVRAKAGDRLAEVVAERDYKVTTGFAGTPYVTWALSETGHVDAAYRLLLEEQNPSWLYPVSMGATTIWERWDSMLPDGTINPGEMTSFNHYALGAVADWIYQVVGGIRPAEPGYAKLLLAPTPGEGLDHAKATLDTRHGHVECGWRREGDGYVVDVVVPEGVPAEVRLPNGESHQVDAGSHSFTC